MMWQIFLLLGLIGFTHGGAPVVDVGDKAYVEIDEEQPIGTILFNFTAEDPDTPHMLEVRGHSALTNDYVNFNYTSSYDIFVMVVSKRRLDREELRQIKLEFVVEDNVGNSVPTRFDIYLKDINDNKPVFKGEPYQWKIDELPYNNSAVFQVSATDADDGQSGSVTYDLKANAQSNSTREDYERTFKINATTGVVSLQKPLNYSTNSYYQFTVYAKDPANETTTDLIISVQDVQNLPPFFIGVPYRVNIEENVENNMVVKRVTARDGDTGISNAVNYSIVPGEAGDCSDLFRINPSEGVIYTAGNIDRDTEPLIDGICVLNVLAAEIETHEPQWGNTTEMTDVTISVGDVNDNAPKFGNDNYTAEIQENSALKIPITLINPTELSVEDKDAEAKNAQIDLSLLYPDGSQCMDFEVVPKTIQKEGSIVIRVNNTELLDYEQVHNITVLVIAKETENDTHVATATVTIQVDDMNDNNPQFVQRDYRFNVSEATPNQTAGVINATDEDSTKYGPVKYTLNGGNRRFQIDPKTGEVKTTCIDAEDCATNLDRELASVYYMTITATDMDGASGGRSNSTSLTVTLIDVNDNAPEFTRSSPITVFIDENDNKYVNTPLVTLKAHDRDEVNNTNSEVRYNISAVSQDMFDNFTIDDVKGELFLTHPVDFEGLRGSGNIQYIEVVVEAIDKGEPPLSSNITVIITVQDMNDNEPRFNETTYIGRVHENETSAANSSAYVGRVFATDDDGSDRNKAISYYVISGSSDRFRINSTTGEVSVQLGAKLDRETVPNYNITIYAIDHGSPPQTGTATIHVEILDVNDESPQFRHSTYSYSVKEADNGTLITCDALDEDLDDNLNYSITDVKAFDENGQLVEPDLVKDYFIIEPSNGTVSVASLTDRETAETISLTILVEDLNAFHPSPQIDTAVLTITLLDINDNDPQFDQTNYTMHVSENAMNGTRLDPVHATDRDVNRSITYTLQPGPKPTASFKILNTTGTIIKDGYIDRETHKTVDLIVVATDNGVPKRSSSVVVTIEIIDFNDNAPVFTNNETEVSVEENSMNGTKVIQMEVVDIDEGPNAEIKYSFSDTSIRNFGINGTTGLVTVSGPIDREEVSRYSIQVIAKDQPLNVKEQKTSIITIIINVDDVNDNAPNFTSTLYNAKIREDSNVGSSVTTLVALDADFGNNSVVQYMFENDTYPSGLFKIDADTGLVTSNRSLMNLANFYVIIVTAQDGGNPPLANSTLLNVTILDVNLNHPVIGNPPKDNLLRVYECTKPGYILHTFNYSDHDHGINAEADFNITAGSSEDDISPFHMSSDGELTLVFKLNYTTKQQYQIQVQVTDRGLPPLSSKQPVTITIEVLDINDHEPTFKSKNVTLNVAENSPNVTYIGTVTAYDPDHGSISCYEILPGNESDYFTVGYHTGQINTSVSFDREVISQASFRLKVEECSIVSNVSDACEEEIGNGDQDDIIDVVRVDVIIDDQDDNPPEFRNEEIITGMRRTTEVGTILELKLKDKEYVSDLDTDKHGINAWKFINNGTITAAPGLSIGPESGTNNCKDSKKHIFCIAENGSITNNRFFSEDLSGFFLVPIKVSDSAGFDQSNLRIYLIGDDQVLKMVLFGPKELVSTKKDEILQLYSRITGHTFVYSGITDHKTPSGQLDTLKTDLFFHVVEPSTHRILYSNEAINMIDGHAGALQEAVRKYSVIEIVPSLQTAPEDDNLERTIYILAAVVAALAVTVVIIVYVAVTTRLKYQNKLKAATVASTESKVMMAENPLFVPNSNKYSKQSNPLLNSEMPLSTEATYDNRSLGSTNSLDENDVGEIRDNSDTIYDAIEEKEVRMNIFEEKSDPNMPEESPLDAVMRIHSMQSMASEATAKSNEGENTGDTDPNFVTVSGIDNATFIGDLESTEI